MPGAQKRLGELNSQMAADNFWNNREQAQKLIEEAGFDLVRQEDVSENAAAVSKRWHDARADDRDALLTIEGEERYAGLQGFLEVVHRLTSERRLSRFVYLARKPKSV